MVGCPHSPARCSVSFIFGFRRARRGSMSILGAVGVAAVTVAASGAIDYTREVEARATFQRHVDAATLQGVHSVSASDVKDDIEKDLRRRVGRVLRDVSVKILKDGDADQDSPGGVFNGGGKQLVVVTANGFSPSWLLSAIGIKSPSLRARSAIERELGYRRLEFTPISASGWYSKDIFMATYDAAGREVSRQLAMKYRYNGPCGSTSSSFQSTSAYVDIPANGTFKFLMVSYVDSDARGGCFGATSGGQVERILTVSSGVDGAPTSTSLSTPAPNGGLYASGVCGPTTYLTHRWEDGGGGQYTGLYTDVQYRIRCPLSGATVVGRPRLVR